MNIDKNKKYEGYIWMSDREKPDVLREVELKMDFTNVGNPFAIEAQLFDKQSLTSYSVKFIDGEYHIKEFKLNEGDLLGPQKIVPKSRLKDVKNLKFIQKWELPQEGDPLCEGMKALIPAALVFVGFEYLKEEEV